MYDGPMYVSVYVRHLSDCPKKEDRDWKRCDCPKWFYSAEWKPDRRSAKTRSWERAEKLARRMEEGEIDSTAKGQTVADAVSLFLEDKQQQGIEPSSYSKVDRLLRIEFLPFCNAKPVQYLDEINLAILEEFRKTWNGVAITRRKKQERLRSFFHYCVRHEWLRKNPALNLSKIKVEQKPTDCFTREEFSKLLDSIPLFGLDSRNPNSDAWRQKIRALIMLMRWSGLRIGDAVTLERKRLLPEDKLMLYTQKTGVPVYVPLKPDVAQMLRELSSSNPKYFFWSGNGNQKSAIGDYQRSFRRLCIHAQLGKRSHPHMLRDTFAVEMLLAGVPLEQVAILLGHSSVKITEKHYSPFVRARQEQVERSVRSAWAAAASV
jgi:integrase/recombinase XerD